MNVFARAETTHLPGVAEPTLPALDERTLRILERRRSGAGTVRRGWLIRRMLAAADLVGLVLAFLLAAALTGTAGGTKDHVSGMIELLVLLATLPGWIILAKLHGLYDRDEERTHHSTVDDIVGVFHLVTVGAWLVYLGAAASPFFAPDLGRVALFWGLAVLFIPTARAIARTSCRRSVDYVQNTIIVGAGDVGQLAARKILTHPEYGLNVVGFVDADPKERREDLGHLALLGPPEHLRELVALLSVERVIVAFSNESHERTLALVRSLDDMDVQIDIVPRLFEIMGPKTAVHTMEGIPVVGLPPLRLARSSRLLKRALDVTVSLLGLLVLAPLFAGVAAAIKLESPGSVLFRQVRRGAGERTFTIYKFRTMVADAEAQKRELAHLNMHARAGGDPRMFKIPNDPRITRVGAILRRTRIDELPQLINVLKGEMSLVGPRPLILDEDRHVTEWARRRLDLKPGVTGLWQVLGASDIPFDEMTKLDYLYVTNWSLWGDVRLMLLTLPSLLRKRVAY